MIYDPADIPTLYDEIRPLTGGIDKNAWYRRNFDEHDSRSIPAAVSEKAGKMAIEMSKKSSRYYDAVEKYKSLGAPISSKAALEKWLYDRYRCEQDINYVVENLGFRRPTDLDLDFCDWLWATRNEPERCVLMFRGARKTTKMQALMVWMAILHPMIRILVLAGNKKSGEKAIVEELIRRLESVEFFHQTFPDLFAPREVITKERWVWATTTGMWNFRSRLLVPSNSGQSIRVITPSMSGTGAHNEVTITDDLENQDNFRSDVEMEKAKDLLGFDDAMRDPDDLRDDAFGAKIPPQRLNVGTPYTENGPLMDVILKNIFEDHEDRYRMWLSGGNYVDSRVYCRPAFYVEEATGQKIYTTPEYWNEKVEKKKFKAFRHAPGLAEAMYLLRPVSESGLVFEKPHNFFPGGRLWSSPSDIPTPLNCAMFIDFSGTESEAIRGDSTVIDGWGCDPSEHRWQLSTMSGRWNNNEMMERAWATFMFLNKISACPVVFGYQKVTVEERIIQAVEAYFADMYKRTSSSMRRCVFQSTPGSNSVNKYVHIKTALQWLWKGSMLHLHPDSNILQMQMMSYAAGYKKHDDELDAAAHCNLVLNKMRPNAAATYRKPGIDTSKPFITYANGHSLYFDDEDDNMDRARHSILRF